MKAGWRNIAITLIDPGWRSPEVAHKVNECNRLISAVITHTERELTAGCAVSISGPPWNPALALRLLS